MDTIKKYINYISTISNGQLLFRVAVFFWSLIVYSAALVVEYMTNTFQIGSLIYSIVVAIPIHILLFSYSNYFTKTNRVWIYFVLQGGLIFFSAFLIPRGMPAVLIGMLPILVFQSIVIFHNKGKVFLVFTIIYCLYCLAMGLSYGGQSLPMFIIIFLFVMTVVNFYSVIYNRQVHAKERTEYYLHELEKAYKQVEQLTISNERQRMARDLHDTLAQGLAGIIMQLDAVDVHLQNGNVEKSRDIIKKSMVHARETLKDARSAIDHLRVESLEEKNFKSEVLKKIKAFTDTTSVPVVVNMEAIQELSLLKMEHCLYILGECLANIAKHANAKKVSVTILKVNHRVVIEIEDNGVGFNPDALRKNSGKYGLFGLKERTGLIEGKIFIHSIPGEGTKVNVMVPI